MGVSPSSGASACPAPPDTACRLDLHLELSEDGNFETLDHVDDISIVDDKDEDIDYDGDTCLYI